MPYFDEKTSPHNQWTITDEGYQPAGRTIGKLEPGIYKASVSAWLIPTITLMELKTDELVSFKRGVFAEITQEIDEFWKRGALYERFGFLHRRGYLLYGPQGCGKSSLIYQIAQNIATAGHIALVGERVEDFLACVQSFRRVEPNRPLICILEDLDTLIHDDECSLLQWLDGNTKTDKVVTIATTNYPEKLDKRVIARPRRFDRIIPMRTPDTELRYVYFSRKLEGSSGKEIDLFTEKSEGLSFAALADLVISVKCMGKDLDGTVALLNKLEHRMPSSQDDFFATLDADEESVEEEDELEYTEPFPGK